MKNKLAILSLVALLVVPSMRAEEEKTTMENLREAHGEHTSALNEQKLRKRITDIEAKLQEARSDFENINKTDATVGIPCQKLFERRPEIVAWLKKCKHVHLHPSHEGNKKYETNDQGATNFHC